MDLERYKQAWAKNAIPRQTLEDQEKVVLQDKGTVKNDEGTVQYDQVQVELLPHHLAHHRPGRACGWSIPGNLVTANSTTTLVVVTQMQPITVIFTLAEDNLPQVLQHTRGKQPAQGGGLRPRPAGHLATGKLTSIDNQIDTTTGTVKLRAEFDNATAALFPNQFVNTRLLVKTLENQMLIPSSAIQHNGNTDFVYLIQDNKAVHADREVGKLRQGRDRGQGIKPGDVVANSSFEKLQNGSQITISKIKLPATSGDTTGSPRPMNPSRPFILRPVATALLMAAILLVGIVAFLQLPVSALPEVDYPTIQVLTFYPGASPDVMATTVTAPLERQFGEMQGLSQMTSTSAGGVSVIVLQFNLTLGLDVAEEEVQASINGVADVPAVRPAHAAGLQQDQSGRCAGADAGGLLQTPCRCRRWRTWWTRAWRRSISQLSGVGLVSISGGQKPAVRIQVNPIALSAYGLNMEDVRTALTQASVNSAKGNFDGPRQDYQIDANDQITDAAGYRNVVIAYSNGAPVFVKDVANVVNGVENTQPGRVDESRLRP